jgi:hypothetical protein
VNNWLRKVTKVQLAPPGAAVRRALMVLAAALPIVVLAAFLGGMPGTVWAVLGLVTGATSRAFLDTARSAALALAIAGLVAAATSVAGTAVPVGLIVAGAALLGGLADRWSAGSATLAPVTAAIAGTGSLSGPPGLSWWEAASWILAGAAYGIAALALLRTRPRPRQVEARRAAAHAAMLAALCGAAAGLAVAFGLPHGYWIVLSLASTLRPVVRESPRRAVQRITGTLLGVLIPIPLVYFLPSAALIPIAALSTLALVSYLFAGEYTREAVFMTVTLVIVTSGGVKASAIAVGEIRLAWTILGALVAGAAATALWRLERDWPD